MDGLNRYHLHKDQNHLVRPFGYEKLVASAIIIFFSFTFSIVPPGYAGPLQFQEPSTGFEGICQATAAKKLILDCSYHPGAAVFVSSPHLRLVHASLSFEVKGENYMSLSLQIANEDTVRLAERRNVFIEIDDPKGNNYLRRLLPHADLALLEPGETRTFSEKLLVGSFQPGDYIIFLWIPSSEKGQTYNSKKNFLLGGENVATPDNGLNKLAQFEVPRSSKR